MSRTKSFNVFMNIIWEIFKTNFQTKHLDKPQNHEPTLQTKYREY